MQDPAQDGMFGGSGWTDDFRESGVFLPRQSLDENHAAVNVTVATIAAPQRAIWPEPKAPVTVLTDCLKHLFGAEISLSCQPLGFELACHRKLF